MKFVLVALFGAACGGPSPPDIAPPQVEVSLLPEAAADAIAPVSRFHVTGPDVGVDGLFLFRGELSSYALARVRGGELSSTLAERRVEAYAFRDAEGIWLSPSVPLVSGEIYTLTALGRGLLGAFRVQVDGVLPVARRIFPPPSASGRRWVFCGELPSAIDSGTVRLEPGGWEAQVGSGVDSSGRAGERCLHLDVDANAQGVSLPPVSVGGVFLDPGPVGLDSPGVVSPVATCHADESAMGPGCATPLDDRVVVRTASTPLLWSVSTASGVVVEATLAGGRFVIRGLTPDTSCRLEGMSTSLDGGEIPWEVTVQMGPPRAHVVLNEVLANPLGAEPAQEWVELVNDGPIQADLAGFRLEDAAGGTDLPPAQLAPGVFALLVAQGFDTSAGRDVPPAPGTPLLRVPRLGQSGLSNAGEVLRLRAPDGTVASVFPAAPAAEPGVSIARRDPSSPDGDRQAFAPSLEPGASPGAANHIAVPE